MDMWMTLRRSDLVDAIRTLAGPAKRARSVDKKLEISLLGSQAIFALEGRQCARVAAGLWPATITVNLAALKISLERKSNTAMISLEHHGASLLVAGEQIKATRNHEGTTWSPMHWLPAAPLAKARDDCEDLLDPDECANHPERRASLLEVRKATNVLVAQGFASFWSEMATASRRDRRPHVPTTEFLEALADGLINWLKTRKDGESLRRDLIQRLRRQTLASCDSLDECGSKRPPVRALPKVRAEQIRENLRVEFTAFFVEMATHEGNDPTMIRRIGLALGPSLDIFTGQRGEPSAAPWMLADLLSEISLSSQV